MLTVQLHDLTLQLAGNGFNYDWGQDWGLLWNSPIDATVLAQQFNTDVFAPTRAFFNNFIKSGQAWAFLIGLILGYLFRSLTSYG